MAEPTILPLLRERRSVREYDEAHELDAADLASLLEAARWAPSAGNSQPWAFLVGRRGDAAHRRSSRCWRRASGAGRRRRRPWSSPLHQVASGPGGGRPALLRLRRLRPRAGGRPAVRPGRRARAVLPPVRCLRPRGSGRGRRVPPHWSVTTGVADRAGRRERDRSAHPSTARRRSRTPAASASRCRSSERRQAASTSASRSREMPVTVASGVARSQARVSRAVSATGRVTRPGVVRRGRVVRGHAVVLRARAATAAASRGRPTARRPARRGTPAAPRSARPRRRSPRRPRSSTSAIVVTSPTPS